ncbi:DUF3019 domain-containing protein [Pseudoalteromonas xiamenensis]|uniref:DUF3019 domain-containing protein n=1 Tax=Pseudoalteromonas xiamenensis TaxID=882626 RepID=UPI0027E3ECAE|nr:DUF3019 domain-containing protein [Pseudoalteromonas xiamenensis]WMN60553.1 DUF3019 domain-containing protein [Pseudoalteromonas xiamenensis]
MYSKLLVLALICAPMHSLAATSTEASDITLEEAQALKVSPNKCVALNEGRTCFADVTFTLQMPDRKEYCLREKDQAMPIGCWKEVQTVNYLYSFARTQTVTYELVARESASVIAEGTIEVNWVHKIRTKKRRWRLF